MHRLHCEECHLTVSDYFTPSWHISCAFQSPLQHSMWADASKRHGT